MTNEDSTQVACAALREKYNIPGTSLNSILPFVDKVISKKKLKGVIRMPKFIKFNKSSYLKSKDDYIDNMITKLGFPMFAKPIDLVSSIETHYIPEREKLIKISNRILQHSYEFEIDEFIDGELFHCDAMIIDQSVKFFMVGKCSFALSRFFEGKPVGSIPILDQKLFDSLQVFCEKVFTKLNCPSGAYHMEVFLDKKIQQFVFLEIGARTGGALITKVYEKLFDINIEETNYLIQMEIINDLSTPKKDIFAGFLNFPKISGKVFDIKKPHIDINYEFIEFVRPGDELRQAENLLDISCSIIFWDTNYEKVEETFEFLKGYHPLVMKNCRSLNPLQPAYS